MLDARNNARRGTALQQLADDPRFLLQRAHRGVAGLRDKLSRAEQSFASELRDTGNKLGARRSRSARMTRTGRWTRWSGC